MVAYERERTDAGNDAEEGASWDSLSSADAFIFRMFKPLGREETSENFNSCTIVLCMNLYENKNAFQSKTYHLRNTEIIKTFKMGWTLLPVDMTFTLNNIDLQMALTFE